MADELITTTQVGQLLRDRTGRPGAAYSPASVRKILSRDGVQPVDRLPGRGGENRYRRDDVEEALAARVGQGRKPGRQPST